MPLGNDHSDHLGFKLLGVGLSQRLFVEGQELWRWGWVGRRALPRWSSNAYAYGVAFQQQDAVAEAPVASQVPGLLLGSVGRWSPSRPQLACKVS
jgi:hypothetical protein